MSAHVPLPQFVMRDGTPVSAAFDDVYFSRAGGIAETEHVFLRGNGLPERFAHHTDFHIAELGFGTGLNFLVTWKAFAAHAPQDAHLHYLAVEKFPLTPAMLTEALAAYPELADYAAALIAATPLRLPGWHRIHLPRVTLTLGFGEAGALLCASRLMGVSPPNPLPSGSPGATHATNFFLKESSTHAFFLDGFAPAKNPDMWSDAALDAIATMAAPDATFATFTAAGAVRRGLAARGFAVEKIPGFGHKREMLVGQRNTQAEIHGMRSALWREPLAAGVSAQRVGGKEPPSILILGAGIAGATTARALAERGFRVTVLDRGAIAGGASGNAAGVLFPQLTKRWTPSAAWYFAGYSFALAQLARWKADGLSFAHAQCGMVRLPRHEVEEAQLRMLNETLGLDASIAHWVEANEARDRAGVSLTTGGAWFPHGTWVAPGELCAALLTHPNITLNEHTEATALTREGAGWRVETRDETVYETTHCILATAHDTTTLAPHPLTLNAVGGQVSVFEASDVSAPLRAILCHKGYVIPAGERVLIGATYNHGDASYNVTDENHAKNIAEVETFLPGWIHGQPRRGRTSLRATTPDRLPYVGALAEGLYVSAGHGSRGLLSAPLGAEIIASAIAGEHTPVTADLLAAVNPLRFTK